MRRIAFDLQVLCLYAFISCFVCFRLLVLYKNLCHDFCLWLLRLFDFLIEFLVMVIASGFSAFSPIS